MKKIVQNLDNINKKKKKEPTYRTSTKILGLIVLGIVLFLIILGIFNK